MSQKSGDGTWRRVGWFATGTVVGAVGGAWGLLLYQAWDGDNGAYSIGYSRGVRDLLTDRVGKNPDVNLEDTSSPSTLGYMAGSRGLPPERNARGLQGEYRRALQKKLPGPVA